MLTVLGGLAEFERELIRARTGEGRARAKARGVKMGRKPKLTPHQIKEAIKRRDARRAVARHRAELQCQPQHDFEAMMSDIDLDRLLHTLIHAYDFQVMIGDIQDYLDLSERTIEWQLRSELQSIRRLAEEGGCRVVHQATANV